VLATAAEAIRIITALVYPILPESAAKVWLQLGQGEIADAAKQAFLTELAWGGLKAGTGWANPRRSFPARKRTQSNVCKTSKIRTARASLKPPPTVRSTAASPQNLRQQCRTPAAKTAEKRGNRERGFPKSKHPGIVPQ
jgi:hypothetical protein